MKDKAQEALNDLFDEVATEYDVDDDGELLIFDCTNHDKYLNMREPIQQVLDCRFDTRELTMIARCVSVACFNNEVEKNILIKIKKQLALLEVEDESTRNV